MKFLFLIMMISGTLISISSNSWFGVWMGLEINLLSFVPLMSSTKNVFSSEASLKYFLVQAMASSIILFSIINLSFTSKIFDEMNSFIYSLNQWTLLTSLMLKMGAAPLHFWFPGVMNGLTWSNCLILMVWQKIAPMMLISLLESISIMMMMSILMSVIVGSIGGLSQMSIRKILAYSSINHIGWMLAAMILSQNLWMIYFMIYSLISATIVVLMLVNQLFHLNQTMFVEKNSLMKFALFTNLLSLGGLPPFLGFLPKWLVIQNMTGFTYIMIIMVVMTLMTLFYYMRMSYSAFLITNTKNTWMMNSKNNLLNNVSYIASSISMMGLLISLLMI
uniref:NADH-ubiquinone oxidoreductase chain 2 n=1 Tax=Sclerophasma paresisense TaxID=253126 RepID=Q2Q1J5_9NEOP|nr:NADH dehydrogenase subunit 2 [Sclerophasma paresisense]ABB81891.1 NADH dehydrogenase subunit 2 [Sclerophasma paresisense]